MRPNQLKLRCYAEHADGQWQAVCLDLNLAAQDDTFKGVKEKLAQMMASYVYDALVGVDKEHADDLLSRSAPLSLWAKYYRAVAERKLRQFFGRSLVNRETVPYRNPVMVPAGC